jgi:hypothetical protein
MSCSAVTQCKFWLSSPTAQQAAGESPATCAGGRGVYMLCLRSCACQAISDQVPLLCFKVWHSATTASGRATLAHGACDDVEDQDRMRRPLPTTVVNPAPGALARESKESRLQVQVGSYTESPLHLQLILASCLAEYTTLHHEQVLRAVHRMG